MSAAYIGKHNVTVCLSVPSAYSPWLTRGQHAARPAYISARQQGGPTYLFMFDLQCLRRFRWSDVSLLPDHGEAASLKTSCNLWAPRPSRHRGRSLPSVTASCWRQRPVACRRHYATDNFIVHSFYNISLYRSLQWSIIIITTIIKNALIIVTLNINNVAGELYKIKVKIRGVDNNHEPNDFSSRHLACWFILILYRSRLKVNVTRGKILLMWSMRPRVGASSPQTVRYFSYVIENP